MTHLTTEEVEREVVRLRVLINRALLAKLGEVNYLNPDDLKDCQQKLAKFETLLQEVRGQYGPDNNPSHPFNLFQSLYAGSRAS